ncbi:MAG: VanZ family protein [Chitinophagales bacterium]|nr:VanZ family protein [Chitinophagales bacterium]
MEKIFKYPIIRWAILILYISLVITLCLLPSSSIPSNTFFDKIYFDKWVHLMMHFGTWTLWVWRKKGIGNLTDNRDTIFLHAFIAVFFLGIWIEILQSMTSRAMDWTDILANMTGAILAWKFWLRFENKWSVYQW